ncbi:hypothetical protein P7K49_004658 [Saguinus oedipus]|uniref:Helically-extended SH3 domain-containing protein n=1 Tax=Saguinus oedipus TaxID=9490 RepID=A0ABQ9W8S8_SAGOE|nr:hypothetical protein P7K49_004658 [Saguinus oedipus]
MGDEVYDDVDTSDFPVPSAEMSQGPNIGKAKTEEKDLKKLKKLEKEEKDFRKKFKYDGEIRVLYSTKVASSITSKKWGTRDLQVKPGDSLEVIQNTDDTKVLCRNEEGKCKSLLTLNQRTSRISSHSEKLHNLLSFSIGTSIILSTITNTRGLLSSYNVSSSKNKSLLQPEQKIQNESRTPNFKWGIQLNEKIPEESQTVYPSQPDTNQKKTNQCCIYDND